MTQVVRNWNQLVTMLVSWSHFTKIIRPLHTDFTYTDVHGAADARHAELLVEGLKLESGMYSDFNINDVTKGAEIVVRLMRRIYTGA